MTKQCPKNTAQSPATHQPQDDLDDLFRFQMDASDDHHTNTLLKQAKRKSTLRVAIISTLIALIVLALGGIFKMQITPHLVDRQIMVQESFYGLYGANNFLANWDKNAKFLGSKASTTLYKLVEGVPVPWKPVNLETTTVDAPIHTDRDPDWLNNQYADVYAVNGQKMMQFYAPGVPYTAYSNDLARIAQIAPQKVVEVGLSFNRAYPLSDLQAFLPESIHLVWCWVATDDQQALLVDERGLVVDGSEIFGFPLINKVGTPLAAPLTTFKMTLEMAQRQGAEAQSIQRIYEQLGGDNLSEHTVPIIGAVVTGRAADMARLQTLPCLKAASLGAVTDKY